MLDHLLAPNYLPERSQSIRSESSGNPQRPQTLILHRELLPVIVLDINVFRIEPPLGGNNLFPTEPAGPFPEIEQLGRQPASS